MRTVELEPRRVVADAAPADDDTLHEFIVHEYGIDVPRVACCSEHVAPFVALADLFFGRVDAALWHAARGAGKTTLGALWIALTSRCLPGYSSLMVAASDVQGGRGAFDHFVLIDGAEFRVVVTPSRTVLTLHRRIKDKNVRRQLRDVSRRTKQMKHIDRRRARR